MKRLVVCCDGTWNRADSKHVTNIEKIARTVETDLLPGARPGDPPVQQMVVYLSGVGTSGYLADRLLGGAFGFGLFENVSSGYRWLALNYEPGDEIFVFGFSRGAYTARSLVGMIGRVGLLTRDSLIADQLPEAVDRYRRRRPDPRSWHGSSDKRFREVNSHAGVTVAFLGVFDTVGALGVPGAFWRRHQFHDVELSDAVLCARQALAVDEHRMKFEPSLWEASADGAGAPAEPDPVDPRVKQVWFEGAHSDVGGGYAATGLSDTALEWMTKEAESRGLRFDEPLLATYAESGSAAVRHNSTTFAYHLLNLGSRVRLRLRPPRTPHFHGDQRVLGRGGALSVGIASSTATHYRDDCADRKRAARAAGAGADAPREWYRPANLVDFDEQTHGFVGREEPVVAHP